MAAEPQQREPAPELQLFPLPEPDPGVRAHHPRPIVGVQPDRRTPERPAPLDHRAVEMRMRDRDPAEPARRLDHPHRRIVDQADAVPEQVPSRTVLRRGRHQERPLPDRKARLRADPEQPVTLGPHRQPMPAPERLERGPPLPAPAHELALVGAHRTDLERPLARRKLHATGDADRMHGPQPPSSGRSFARTSAMTAAGALPAGSACLARQSRLRR